MAGSAASAWLSNALFSGGANAVCLLEPAQRAYVPAARVMHDEKK
jgi:hypothetical protein